VTPLRAIRLAMMGGVLMFGVVSWVLTRNPDWVAPNPAIAGKLTMVGQIIWGLAAAALIVMFLKFRGDERPARASNVAIIAWALGEALALFGGVVFFMTAVPVWYVAGVIVLALTFVAFPPPQGR
jgi:hypothetical protein